MFATANLTADTLKFLVVQLRSAYQLSVTCPQCVSRCCVCRLAQAQ